MLPEERKLRKWWLWLTLLPSGFFLAFIALALIFISFPADVFWIGVSQVVLGTFFLWLLYYCAYKNPGTGLLTFAIVMSCLGIVLNLIDIFASHGGKLWGELFSVIYGVVWCYLSLKMRKLNKKLQQQ